MTADRRPRYTVYVIELDEKVWELARMRNRNPDRDRRKPCVYVGQTAHTPEYRFAQHKEASSSTVGRYGVRLRPRLSQNIPTAATRQEAERAEAAHAERLRRRGFGVWEGRLGPLGIEKRDEGRA